MEVGALSNPDLRESHAIPLFFSRWHTLTKNSMEASVLQSINGGVCSEGGFYLQGQKGILLGAEDQKSHYFENFLVRMRARFCIF